jgi:hypothetical protein
VFTAQAKKDVAGTNANVANAIIEMTPIRWLN